MRNAFHAVVESCDRRDSFAWLRLGRGRLAARLWPGIRKGQRVRVAIRPEDVVLCSAPPGRTSARNLLPGHVRRTRYAPEGLEVELDVGFPLAALVTRRSGKDLGLRRAASVFALVKATAIQPMVNVTAGIRVSLVGRAGLIDLARIDLLRAVNREGTLWRAARALRLSYPTAWRWARIMNRNWGKLLLARTQGGRGGGGTTLTPQGYAVLRRVSEIEGAHST